MTCCSAIYAQPPTRVNSMEPHEEGSVSCHINLNTPYPNCKRKPQPAICLFATADGVVGHCNRPLSVRKLLTLCTPSPSPFLPSPSGFHLALPPAAPHSTSPLPLSAAPPCSHFTRFLQVEAAPLPCIPLICYSPLYVSHPHCPSTGCQCCCYCEAHGHPFALVYSPRPKSPSLGWRFHHLIAEVAPICCSKETHVAALRGQAH